MTTTKTVDRKNNDKLVSGVRHSAPVGVSAGREVESVSNASYIRGLSLVLVAAAALYLSLSWWWPKFSRAEVFFAECAREMIATGNLITPLYHGQAFFDKPILCYWMIIGCFDIFGVSHFAARIPSVLASLATIAVTAQSCRTIFGARAALLSAMALATSFMYLSFSALCMSDMWLVLCDTTALALMFAGLTNHSKRTLNWFLAACAMGVGFLVKGPVAIVLPAAFFLIYLGVTRQFKTVKLKHVLLGALAMCLIATPWFIMAYSANGMEAMTYFFIRENVQRFAGATYDTHRPIWFMFVSLMTGFLPWSAFLPFALLGSFKRLRDAVFGKAVEKVSANVEVIGVKPPSTILPTELYLWLWIAVVVGFFSVSRGKIDYYALPAFPACAILVGAYLNRWIHHDNKWVKICAAYVLPVGLIVTGVGLAILTNCLPYPTALPAALVAAVPILFGVIGLIGTLKKSVTFGYGTAFGGIVASGIIYASIIMPVLTKMSPALDYAVDIKSGPKAANVGMFAGIDHWVDAVTFRSEREPVRLKTSDEVSTFLATPGPHWLIVQESDFNNFSQDVKERLNIVRNEDYIPKSINPGYIIRRRGDLTGGCKLILAQTKELPGHEFSTAMPDATQSSAIKLVPGIAHPDERH